MTRLWKKYKNSKDICIENHLLQHQMPWVKPYWKKDENINLHSHLELHIDLPSVIPLV